MRIGFMVLTTAPKEEVWINPQTISSMTPIEDKKNVHSDFSCRTIICLISGETHKVSEDVIRIWSLIEKCNEAGRH